MSEVINKNSRWRHKENKRVAYVLHAASADAFPAHRSAHGDASDDAYADLAAANRLNDTTVMYRYEKKSGRSIQTVSVKRGRFLKLFEKIS